MALNLRHQTVDQFLTAFRLQYHNSVGTETARLASRLLALIDAADVTELQVRTAFGLTNAQWLTLKAKMTAMRTRFTAIQADRGE